MRSLCSPVSTVRTALLSSPMRLCLVSSHHDSIVALWVGETTVTSALRNAKRLAALKHSEGFWCGRIRGPVWFLLADEIQRALQFQLELCAFGQVDLLAAPGFHQVGFQRSQCRAFRGLFLVLVFYAVHRAHGGARGCRLCGVFLCAAAAFDHAFLNRAGLDAVIARHGSNFCNDWQLAE